MRSAATVGTFGNKLRRLAVNLSSTSQTASMEEFVGRFFSTGQAPPPKPVPSPDEPNPEVDKAPLPSAAPKASNTRRKEAKKKAELLPAAAAAAVSSSNNADNNSMSLDDHSSSSSHQQQQQQQLDNSSNNVPLHQHQKKTSITPLREAIRHDHDHERSSAVVAQTRTSYADDEADDVDADAETEAIRQELFENENNQSPKQPTTLRRLDSLIQKKLQKQKELKQLQEQEQEKQNQQQDQYEIDDDHRAHREQQDNRSLVEMFDEVVSVQMVNQPDEDVITIVIRSNVPEERRLFQYFVCGELWFLSLNGADTSYMTDEDWATRIAGGAKLALDALVNKKPGAREICISSREDLNVYFMPDWSKKSGVGITLDEMRDIMYQKSISSENKNNNNNNDNNEHPSSTSSAMIPARDLIPTSEKCFAPDQDNDVLAVPFEPQGMRLAAPVGDTRPGEMQTLSLSALSDKRTGRTDPIDPEEGQIVAGRFRIDQKVGSATFSDAYAVTLTTGPNDEIDEETAPVACIKCIKTEFFDQALDEVRLLTMINEEAQRRYDEAIELLNREQKNNTTLEETSPEITNAVRMSYYECGADACHVVRLADAFYFRHRMFVVTELLKENLYETTCATINHEPYWFDISRLGMIAKQITTALDVIHSLGLIHCDVKPENIMVQSHSRCRVKLIDFGSSSYLHERFSSYVQSRSYRAPEIVAGAAYDGRADIWSLGGVLVELAARGEILFRSTTLSNMMARIVSVCGALPESLLLGGSHSDCLATKSGALFAQFGEADDERFERFEQHPFFSTAQSVAAKIEKEREANNNSNDEDFDINNNDEDKSEIWLHFPVFNGVPAEEVKNRQSLWKIDRSARSESQTNGAWSDIYEPNGRIEHLLEHSGGWDLASIALGGSHLGLDEDANNSSASISANEPVAPELLFLDFVKKCLILDPTERPSSKDLLKHPFISMFGCSEEDALLHGQNNNNNNTANDNNSSTQQQEQQQQQPNQDLLMKAIEIGRQNQQKEQQEFDEEVYDDDDEFVEEGQDDDEF